MTEYNPRYDDDNSLDEEDLVANQSNPGLYIIGDLDLSTSNGVYEIERGDKKGVLMINKQLMAHILIQGRRKGLGRQLLF